MNINIKISTSDYNVEDFDFSFKYTVKMTGDVSEERSGTYSCGHSWIDRKEKFIEILKSGLAVEMVVEEVVNTMSFNKQEEYDE